MGAECCPGKIVKQCVCAKAQTWKPRAMSVLHIINTARGDARTVVFLDSKRRLLIVVLILDVYKHELLGMLQISH